MFMFNLLLLSYFGFSSHVLHAFSESQLVAVVGEKPVKPPKVLKGRKRLSNFKSGRNKMTAGASYMFDLIQFPRLTIRHVVEGWTPTKHQYREPLLMQESEKSTGTTALLSFGGGIAVMWAINMLIEWFAGKKRHNQAPDSQLLAPLVPTWPETTLRPMKPAMLREILDDRRAMVINVKILLEALYLEELLPVLEKCELAALLTFTHAQVRDAGILENQWADIIDGAEFLQGLSAQLFRLQ